MRFTSIVAAAAVAASPAIGELGPLVASTQTTGALQKVEVETCSPCIQLSTQALAQLLNYVVKAGVGAGCADVCGVLKPKEQSVCQLVCGVVGIKAFSAALKHADIDPIYFCEILKACPAGPDDAAMTLDDAFASPPKVVKGSNVQFTLQLNVTKPTGVGQWAFSIAGPVSQNISGTELIADGLATGPQTINAGIQVQDVNDDQGNPQVVWKPGDYSFEFEVCQGKCGSKHPHSKSFGTKKGTFTVVENQTATFII